MGPHDAPSEARRAGCVRFRSPRQPGSPPGGRTGQRVERRFVERIDTQRVEEDETGPPAAQGPGTGVARTETALAHPARVLVLAALEDRQVAHQPRAAELEQLEKPGSAVGAGLVVGERRAGQIARHEAAGSTRRRTRRAPRRSGRRGDPAPQRLVETREPFGHRARQVDRRERVEAEVTPSMAGR